MDSALHLYALLLLATVPPMIPNSALLAGAGALAATGGLSLPLLASLVLAGTVLGDLAVYGVGRKWSEPATTWLSRKPKRRTALAWTTDRFQRYGVPSVIGVRFIPGGRGMGAVTAGIVGLPFRRFLLAAVLSELIFVSCTVGLGYLGGRLLPVGGPGALLIGPGVSLLVAGVTLLVQRLRRPA
ncbi:VTT domain-containing protein [Nonomuraea sp. NPDC050310]|uniref:DedA family protein n=1 Tax=unclassified Nonomuraea TaxID=2593643 RepID=UPI0033CCA2E5